MEVAPFFLPCFLPRSSLYSAPSSPIATRTSTTVQNKRVLTLDLSGMVAGSKYRGEFEERIKKVIREVIEDGDIVLFLDEMHTIIGAGGAEGAIDASNIRH